RHGSRLDPRGPALPGRAGLAAQRGGDRHTPPQGPAQLPERGGRGSSSARSGAADGWRYSVSREPRLPGGVSLRARRRRNATILTARSPGGRAPSADAGRPNRPPSASSADGTRCRGGRGCPAAEACARTCGGTRRSSHKRAYRGLRLPSTRRRSVLHRAAGHVPGGRRVAARFARRIRPSRNLAPVEVLCWNCRPMAGLTTTSRRAEHLTLAAMCVAQVMIMLDMTIVNVALPSIQSELDVPPTNLEWIVNAYTLALASLILVGGVLGDRYGRKRVFLLGL